MTSTRMIGMTAAPAAAAMAAPMVLARPASASGGGDVRASGTCTNGTGVWKVKAEPDNGAIEFEFEVDTDVVGQAWRIPLRDNGGAVFAGTVRTLAPSGSFTARARAAHRLATDISGARTVRETRVCAVTVRLWQHPSGAS